MNTIIIDRFKEIIDNLQQNEDSIVVAKGINLDDIGLNKINIEKYMKNKREYIKRLSNGVNIISYDEFLLFNEILRGFYQSIYIIDNNLYLNYYPINTDLDENTLNCLIKHFDEGNDDDFLLINNIDDYTNAYGEVRKFTNNIYCVYNDYLIDDKINYIKMWEKSNFNNDRYTYFDNEDVFEIKEEEDYINFLQQCMCDNIKTINITGDFSSEYQAPIKEKIGYISEYFKNIIEIKIGKYKKIDKEVKDYSNYLTYLKKYWGKDSFLDIKMYDVNEIENNKKITYVVSQGKIIDTIVQQCINAKEKKDFNDIFITAPTGAGKSAMFQIPAMYISEIEDDPLMTIVISPLIGLMKDQVKNLELKNYSYARTINSDISPIKKEEIKDDILNRKCNILYISPETLLSRSDVKQLIGDRKIGLFIIDEAHIVTTWGKQFRPDYWFLGDHIKKLRKIQESESNISFPIATFTATAIYQGIENMYDETKESLNMLDPITYLGYLKRDNINIKIKKIEKTGDYELKKFESLEKKIMEAILKNKKMLIYFPTVNLINRFYEYCYTKNISCYVAVYHGQMKKSEKDENYEKFYNKEKIVMIATKAFGMGIDIEDIEIVAHFAPTGNVCDYLQEIGRAARKSNLIGEAYYEYRTDDFKHINRLHGISMIQNYQLVEVIKKVYELYMGNSKKNNTLTRKRREMLVDAQSFSYIFENPMSSEDDVINKVKTAMLIIQKDFDKRGYAPFHIRPIPLFSVGYFKISEFYQDKICKDYPNTLNVVDKDTEICSINLEKIWENKFSKSYSFPQFKYLIYSKDEQLKFKYLEVLKPALILNITKDNNYKENYIKIISAIKAIINSKVREENYSTTKELASELKTHLRISSYKAETIMDIVVSSMRIYERDYLQNMSKRMIIFRELNDRTIKFKFNNTIDRYFKWIDSKFNYIENNLKNDQLFLVNDTKNNKFKEFLLLLGILEVIDVLTFDSKGGSDSQIYMYINETKSMRQIIDKPFKYENKLLKQVSKRHNLSVLMMSYIFDNNFSSDEIWDILEDYFLGNIPKKVEKDYKKKYKEDLF